MVNLNEVVLKKIMEQSLGEDVLPVTLLLNKNDELSELKLANILKIEVNETRRVLYKLHHQNLVSFKKKKDDESGWYTYYWKLNMQRMNNMIDNVSKSSIERLTNLIEKEISTQFYICNDRCIRLEQDNALNYNFKCPECGQILVPEDNSRRIEILRQSLEELKNIFNSSILN